MLNNYKFDTTIGAQALYWYLGVWTTALGIQAFSHAWFIFVLPSSWILNYCINKVKEEQDR